MLLQVITPVAFLALLFYAFLEGALSYKIVSVLTYEKIKTFLAFVGIFSWTILLTIIFLGPYVSVLSSAIFTTSLHVITQKKKHSPAKTFTKDEKVFVPTEWSRKEPPEFV